MTELSEPERDAMAHCIGHHSAKGCSVHGGRNYYAAATADDPMWGALVERGLARRSSRNEATFHLTDSGIAAVEADPRSQRKGRLYTVRFKDCEGASQFYAETRGKARYEAALSFSDAAACSIAEALASVESCRLGAGS